VNGHGNEGFNQAKWGWGWGGGGGGGGVLGLWGGGVGGVGGGCFFLSDNPRSLRL